MRKNERKYLGLAIFLIVILMSFTLYMIWDFPGEIPTATRKAHTNVTAPSEKAPSKIKASSKPALKEWVKQNATQMSSFSSQDEEQMESYVASLDASHFTILKNLVLDQTQPAQERILSAYMLNLAGLRAGRALEDLIQSPLNAVDQPKPHSIDEAAASREKALRVMAIDHLAARAKTDSKAKDQFKKMIPGIQHPWVKSYAERRYRDLK